jgi:hypothetical protein
LRRKLLKGGNVLENYNFPVCEIMTMSKEKPLELLRKRRFIELIEGTYEKNAECKLLEKVRSLFTVLRNLSMIRSNEHAYMKNERLQHLLIQIYTSNSDTELARSCLEILSILSRHIHLKLMNISQEFLKRTFELLNSESSEEIELSVEIMRNLIQIQDNESVLEAHLPEYLDFLAKLLVYQN